MSTLKFSLAVWATIGVTVAFGESPATQPADVQASSLLGNPLRATPPAAAIDKLDAALATAVAELDEHPDDPERLIWVGRRLGYLWRMRDAIETFSAGLSRNPEDPRFLRHRGHRYISIREFDNAIADLTRAAELLAGRPDEIEPDGMPNAKNIPLTTLAFNVYYHLGLAHYLRGDFAAAADAYRKNMEFSRKYDDNLVATTYWHYLALKRLGHDAQAAALLESITPDMTMIENEAYHTLCLMFRGDRRPEDVLAGGGNESVNDASTGYGVGMFYLLNGDARKAERVFRHVVAGTNWPAFGYIAAEAELARMKSLE